MADENLKIIIEAIDKASAEFKKIQDEVKKVSTQTEKASDAIVQANRATKKSFTEVSDAAKKVGTGLTAAAATGVGAITFLASKGAEIEKMKVSLKTAFGGDTAAGLKAFDTISDFAKKTPFEMAEVMDGFIKLKNLGLDPSEAALTSYGNTASAMGKSLNQMIEAVADASTGEFERLKEFGIKAKQEGDKVSFTFQGVTTTVGKNSAEIEKYLMDIGNTKFAGGMEEQSKTLLGIWATLKDNVSLSAAAIGESMGPVLKRVANAIIEITDKIKAFVDENPKLAQLAGTILLIGTAFAAIAGPMLLFIGFIPAILSGIAAIHAAISTLSTPMLVVGAAITSLYLTFKNNFGFIKDFLVSIFDSLKNSFYFFVDIIKANLAELRDAFGGDFDVIAGVVKSAMIVIEFVVGSVLLSIKNTFEFIWVAIKIVLSTTLEVIIGAIQVFVKLLQADWTGAWEAVKDTVSDIWQNIKTIVSDAVDGILGFVKKFVEGVQKAIDKAKELLGIGGTAKISNVKISGGGVSGSFKKNATGGFIRAGETSIVNERGVEYFTPQRSGYIIPNDQIGGKSNIVINITGQFLSEDAAVTMADQVIRNLKLHGAIV